MSLLQGLELSGVRRHDDLYFKDGNLILVAEGICFRVHSSQLTRHSDVFRDMVSIPQPIDALWIDGCPIVELHDTAQELAHMLTALYDSLYFNEGTMVDFPALSAVLRLSTKYFFGCLRRRALARLRLDWPLTLAEWDVRERVATTSEGLYNPSVTRNNPILIINLARELSLPSLLPAAFYDLSRFTPAQILGGSPGFSECPREFLHIADLMLVFLGKEAGQRFTSEFVTKELEDRDPAPWCRFIHESDNNFCQEALGAVMYETLRRLSGLTAGRENDPLFMLQCIAEMQSRQTGTDVAEKVTARACEMCRADLRKAIESARQAVWDNIPRWFKLEGSALEEF